MLRLPSFTARMLAVVAVVSGGLAAQTSVTLTSVKDNTLMNDIVVGSFSNGSGNGIFCGVTAAGFLRRALLKFDFSSIPANAIITNTSLSLRVSRTVAPSTQCDLYRVLADWGEGTSVGNGSGAPSTTNDATWLHRFYPGTFWANAGGDFSPTSSATKMVAGVGFYTITGAGMTADVQSWVASSATNFGWLIKQDEQTLQSAKKFESREAATALNRPRLTVTYTLPPTATVVSTGTGCHATNAADLVFTATGLPQTGNANFALNVANGVPAALTYFYLAGATAAPTAASATCNIYLDVPSALTLLTVGISPVGPFPLNGSGALTLPAGLPNDPSLWGQVIAVQTLSADPASPIGAVLSNALTLTFGV